MSNVFPKNTRLLATKALVGVILLTTLAVGATWYYGTPKYYRVGYAPQQPVVFSHKIHVSQVGLDCLHCHSSVKESPHSNIPTVQVCWNCHGADKGNIKADSGQLEVLKETYSTGRPIPWVQVHKVPDYAYFNHSAHVNRGVSCLSCHGQVNEMDVVRHEQPLSMSWCLDCHRNPESNLRPNSQVTNLTWDATKDPTLAGKTQEEYGKLLKAHSGINAPVTCTGCHR